MNILKELEKAELLIDLENKMVEFIDDMSDGHTIGYLPENTTELMAKAALVVLETIKYANAFFEKEFNTK